MYFRNSKDNLRQNKPCLHWSATEKDLEIRHIPVATQTPFRSGRICAVYICLDVEAQAPGGGFKTAGKYETSPSAKHTSELLSHSLMEDDTSIQELKSETTSPCRLYPVTSLNASRYAPYDSSVTT